MAVKQGASGSNPKVGQTVYLKTTSTHPRDNQTVEGILQAIGTKYYTVTVGPYKKYRFNKNGLEQRTAYSPEYRLYLNEQDMLDDEEATALTEALRDVFKGYGRTNLTLSQLRRIKAVLDGEAKG